MKAFAYRIAVVLLAASASTAHAQLEALTGQGGVKGLTGGLTSGSMGNVAGLLQYCIGNKYLGGDAGSIKDQLMGKMPGTEPTKDPGYMAGAKGLLHSSEGKQVDLSGGAMKGELTKQACDTILAQAKTML